LQISHVSDEHTPTLPANTGAYKIGSSHKARVIGHASLDGLLQLTLKPSILEQKFMKVSEVKVGEVMKGTIKKLTSKGLFVNIHGSVDGVCWPLHYADIRLKNPERRFKVGSTVKCRVSIFPPALISSTP
jgi:rRNA biogenesis protein RRP5